MSQTRISRRFEELRANQSKGLVAYITAGDPTPERTPSLIAALVRGGADIIELGVPFSDPIADGPVIQRASDRALKHGTSVRRVLEIAAEVRKTSEVPLLLFSYLNPLLRYGFEQLAVDAKEAGIDGCLLTDASVEEAEAYVDVLRRHGLDTVFLGAPTSTEERLALVGRYSSGFVYLVSRTGVTGEQTQVSASVEPLVAAMRAQTNLPLAVGFGVSKAEHAAAIGRVADAVVVGSAIVKIVEQNGSSPDLEAKLEAFTSELKSGLRSVSA